MPAATLHRPNLVYRLATWALPVSLLYGAFLMVFRMVATRFDSGTVDSSFLVVALQVVLIAPVSIVIGFLIMRRAPGNIIGPLIVHYAVGTINGGAWGPAGEYLRLLVQFYNQAVLFPIIVLLLLYFPTGATRALFLRRFVYFFLIMAPIYSVLNLLATPALELGGPANPVYVQALAPITPVLNFSFGLVIAPPLLAAIGSIFRRYRASSGQERAQIRWLTLGTATYLLILVGWLVVDFSPLGLDSAVGWFVVLISDTWFWAAIPLAVGIALLRHNLYDIDIIIRRTLVYGVLSAMLALLYWGGVVGLQALLRPLTGEGNDLAIVATTLTVAALFMPLRALVQRVIDRRFYRRKYDAAKTLAAFGQVARDEVELEALKSRLVAVVDDTMQPEHLSVWLRAPEETRPGYRS